MPIMGSDELCYHCEEPGHYAQECSERNNSLLKGDVIWQSGRLCYSDGTVVRKRKGQSTADAIKERLAKMARANYNLVEKPVPFYEPSVPAAPQIDLRVGPSHAWLGRVRKVYNRQ